MTDLLQEYSPHQDDLYSAVLADVLDTLGHRHNALPPSVRPLNPEWRVFGRAMTLQAIAVDEEPEHPYLIEMQCVDALQPGDVLLASTNADVGSALWGELLSTASRARGAVGAIMDGLTRDSVKILEMNFPVFAAGYSPLDSKGRLNVISYAEPIRFGNCVAEQGDLVFGDRDGVVVIPQRLAKEALTKALEKAQGENLVREELAAGRSVQEVFEKYGIL